MASPDEVATRIVVFFTEDDRAGHHALGKALLDRAREDGMAGATIWRGIEGFGASSRVRTSRFPDTNLGLPLALEVIDRPERIERFLPVVRALAPRSLITKEAVRIPRNGGTAAALDDPASHPEPGS